MLKKHKTKYNEKEYIPKFPEKYVGTYPVIYRSSWELKMCSWFDYNRSVLEWASESHRIRYYDPVQGKDRIYYPDFYVKFKNRKKFIVEIKPLKDIRPTKKGKKSKKTIEINERTIATNQAKFKAAHAYAQKLEMEFIVLTEKDLFRRN